VSTYEFIQSGTETLSGTLKAVGGALGDVPTQQADGFLAQAAGGGSGPVGAIYSGNAVTIANTASGNLTWDTLAAGTDLLDRSTPGSPKFLAAGTYAVTASVRASALTAAGWATVSLSVVSLSSSFTAETAIGPSPATLVVVTAVIVVTDADIGFSSGPVIQVTNLDGAASRDFTLNAAEIVKLA